MQGENKPVLEKFVYLYPMTPNVRIETPWKELITNKTWIDDYDLFIGMTEGGQPKQLAPYRIPKVWRTFSHLAPKKVSILDGPVVFNSYTARIFSLKTCRLYDVKLPCKGKYVCYDYKPPEIFTGWTGKVPSALIVSHNFSRRACIGYELYKKLDKDLPIKVIEGNLSFKDLLKEYQQNRVFLELTQGGRLITATIMESMMTGMPVIATPEADFPNFVRPWTEGFLSDNPKTISNYIRLLCYNFYEAPELGHNARQRALELCSYTKIRGVWEDAIFERTKAATWAKIPRNWGKTND